MNKKRIVLSLLLSLGIVGTIATSATTFYPYVSNSYQYYQNPATNNSNQSQAPMTTGWEPTPVYDKYHTVVSSTTTNSANPGTTTNVQRDQSQYYSPNVTKQSDPNYETVNGAQSTNINGNLTSGWGKDNGGKFYRSSDNTKLTGWKELTGKWYFFESSGYMKTGWSKIGSSWYLLDDAGQMVTGWKQVGQTYYYLNSDGSMATGWKQLNGKWYFLASNGAMKTGWFKVGSKWYYANDTGAMQTGWMKKGGKWYYLNKDGGMLTGKFKIGTTLYTADSTGACTW